MGRRIDLQRALEEILGSKNVYFQPPSNVQLNYPCIVYNLSNIRPKFADNLPYTLTDRYTVTYIDRNPDSDVIRKIASRPKTVMDRTLRIDGLNHTYFSIYF